MASMDRGLHGPLVPQPDVYIPSPDQGFDFDAVKDLVIWDQFGNRKRFHTLYQETKTIIIFVRHFLCYVCKEYVEDLAKIPRDYLQEAKVRLVVIGCAPHTYIREFRQETRFPHEFYCDPDRDLHKALGLRLDGTHGKASPHVKSSVISGVLQSTWRAVKSMHYQGDMMQQGGQFIVGPGKKLHYAWRDRNSQDHTSVNQLLAEAGVQQINLPNDPRIIQV
ncbi:peroxiredoxin-like 2C [Amphiura filiformis]|uniref:peroxiredoxin-like 2C n=1 Tax=Amphiura filiformis TaxID=82378 RepID=UPI003B21DC68